MQHRENTHDTTIRTTRKYLLNERGYGMVFGNPKDIFKRVAPGKNYLVIGDFKYPTRHDHTKTSDVELDDLERQRHLDLVWFQRPNVLLDYLTRIRTQFMAKYKVNRDIEFAQETFEYIFVEVGAFIDHYVEYACLMYMCLLHIGVAMPEFYVIVPFPTKSFDYLENHIFTDAGTDQAAVTEYLEQARSKIVDDIAFPASDYSISALSQLQSGQCAVIITRDYNIWQERVSSIINTKKSIYDNLNGPIGETRDDVSVFIIDNPTYIASPSESTKLPKISTIIFDTRIKVEVDLHFYGNVRRLRASNPEWYTHYCKVFKRKYPEAQLYVDRQVNYFGVTRGVKERNPISDVLYFKYKGVDLYQLYEHYYNSTTEFTYNIRAQQDILAKLNYFSENPPYIIPSTHPVLGRLRQIWLDKKYPPFAILIVFAIIGSYTTRHTEITDSDDKQSNRFRSTLNYFLDLMRTYNNVFPNDTLGISENLRVLCKKYQIVDDDYGFFEMSDIMKSLNEIIKESFDSYIIHLKGDTTYRSKFNSNMIWQLSSNETPSQVFPIIVYTTERKKKVELYIQLDTL